MKLPINPLLHLVSLAALAGIGHSVYRYSHQPWKYDKPAMSKIKAENEVLLRKGRAATNINDDRWDYSHESYWVQLQDVNLLGKVEVVKKEADPGAKVPEKPKPEIVQVDDLIEVICITRAGDKSGVVVTYETDVEVPEDLKVKAPTTPVRNTIPKGRRQNRTVQQPLPVAVVGQTPPHHVEVGEALWKPLDYIYLVGVSDDARHVVFELRIPDKKKDGKYPSQKVFKGDLAMLHEVAVALSKGGGSTSDKGESPAKTGKTGPDQPDVPWVDTKETVVSSDGRVNVSEKDRRFLEDNGPEIFTDDVNMRDYSGGAGKHKIRGVQIRKLSSRVRQYGVNQGDVLVSINGIPVTGMANAKKVGSRLYRKGVKTFRAVLLRQGRHITRTFTINNKGR